MAKKRSAKEMWQIIKKELEKVEKQKEKVKQEAILELLEETKKIIGSDSVCDEKLSKMNGLIATYEEILKG